MGRPKKPPVEPPEKCAMLCTLRLIEKKWAILVVGELTEYEELSFSELQRKIQGRTGDKISPSVLSSTLAHLEDYGVLNRRVITTERPVRVKYSLTPSGRKLLVVLSVLKSWGFHWGKKEIKKCDLKTCKHQHIPLIPEEELAKYLR